MTHEDVDALLKLEEIADMTGVPLSTLRYWRSVKSGGPKTFRLGRRVVARESDVLAWIEEARQAG